VETIQKAAHPKLKKLANQILALNRVLSIAKTGFHPDEFYLRHFGLSLMRLNPCLSSGLATARFATK